MTAKITTHTKERPGTTHPIPPDTQPLPPRHPFTTTTTSERGAEAFQKGIQALAQYQEREGGGVPGRAHIEHLPDGSEHRTGVWIANQKQRRDRLDPDQLAALAELGIDWAQ
ncbi:helicase associated domain-containing protein [Streptomyces sp. NPDC091371]|uniref:helicase associated domain-containing protein n=1 Tax=Streptomyces sp. NPDC091371 TaxID=3155303 RepID=UPI003439D713